MKVSCIGLKVISACTLAATLISCNSANSDKANKGPVETSQPQGSLSFKDSEILDSSVSPNVQKIILNDFSVLESMTFPEADPEVAHILGLEVVTGKTLSAWFHDRIHYFVGESFDINTAVSVSSPNYEYTTYLIGMNPLMLSLGQIMAGYADTTPDGFKIAALNLSAGVYSYGKRHNQLMAFTIAGKSIEVKSPRIGVMKITSELFSAHYIVDANNAYSFANTAARLPVLFHEARHSDGSGENIGFVHAVCPDGLYAGDYACDNTSNGAYEVQRVLLKLFMQSCTSCTASQKVQLQLLMDDSAVRLLPNATVQDDRPESVH